MSEAEVIKRDLDALQLSVQEGQAHADDLVAHVEGIEERVEKLAKNAVATAAAIRNAFRRVWDLLKSCLRTGGQFADIVEKIGKAIDGAVLDTDVVAKVRSLVVCLEQAFCSIPLFVRMVEHIDAVKSNLGKVFSATHSFMDQVSDVTKGSMEILRQDAALIERDVQSVLANCLFSLREGAASLLCCCKTARAVELSEGGGPLERLGAECLRALEAFEGKTGVDELGALMASLQDLRDRLKGMHDRFEDKLHSLEKPPEGIFEWLASPFVKTYEAASFGLEVVEDIWQVPGMWTEAKGSARTGKELLQTTHDRMADFWQSFAAMVRQLCDDMWVTYNPQFEDPSIPDVHFDPALGFLSWLETSCLACLSSKTCCEGPRRLAQQAMQAVVRKKSRCLRKWVVVRPGPASS